MRVVAGLLVVLATQVARADESVEPGGGNDPVVSAANRVNMRFGAATSDETHRPVICLDVRIWRGFGVESCGTGQAIIHNEPGKEMAHFRGTWSVIEKPTSRGTGKLRASAGFAELQVGDDHPGFHFGEPDAQDHGSVAGPEAAVQAQWLVPLGKGVELVTSLTAGLAYFAKADKLIVPQNNTQPFVSFEVGLGW